MTQRIHLAQCAHLLRDTVAERYPVETDTAIAALVRRRLSFDVATGALFERRGWVQKYVSQSDYEPQSDSLADAADHMRGAVANSASRLHRGFSA